MTKEGLPIAVEDAMMRAATKHGEPVSLGAVRAIFRSGLLAWPRKWITAMPTPNDDGSVYSYDAIVLPVPHVEPALTGAPDE